MTGITRRIRCPHAPIRARKIPRWPDGFRFFVMSEFSEEAKRHLEQLREERREIQMILDAIAELKQVTTMLRFLTKRTLFLEGRQEESQGHCQLSLGSFWTRRVTWSASWRIRNQKRPQLWNRKRKRRIPLWLYAPRS